MASWGLAFEYGKKAYTDMMKRQEELDRYLAEHNLWEAERIEKEEALATQTAENRKARKGLAVLNKYRDDVVAGDDSAFVSMLNDQAEGTGAKFTLEGKKVYRIKDGNKSLAYDLNSKELKNGSSRVAEFIKGYGLTSLDQYNKYEAGIKDNREMKYKYDELQTRKDVAKIKADGAVNAAGAKGGASTKVTTWSKEDNQEASSYAPSLVFGSGASGSRDENGMWTVTNVDGSARTLTSEDVAKLDKAFRYIKEQAENESKRTSSDPIVSIPGVAVKASQFLAKAEDYNTKIDDFKGDHAKYVTERAAHDAAVARNDARDKARDNLDSYGLSSIAENMQYEDVPALRDEPVFFDSKNNPGLAYIKTFLD